MTVITNAALVLKDRHGNIGTVTSFTDNDIAKIHNAIADIGKLVDPVSHLPIKATATTVGVVQLADAEAIAAGTTGRVVDAKQLQDAVMGVTPANCVTNVAAGSTANKIKVTKDGYTATIVIDNVEHAGTATSANSVAWDKVSGKPSSFTPSSHTHDDRYYTESEIDAKLTDYLPLAGGNVTGNLTVQNKNVVRSVNGVAANKLGDVQLGNIGDITGKIEWFAFNEAPDGYLVCNGANVSRTTYADLFNAIGTTFGSGDGSTTFTLPNLIAKFAQGSTIVGTVKNAGLPNITGSGVVHHRSIPSDTGAALCFDYSNGAFYPLFSSYPAIPFWGINGKYDGPAGLAIDASRSSSIYGNSTTVQPPALTLLPCIKY